MKHEALLALPHKRNRTPNLQSAQQRHLHKLEVNRLIQQKVHQESKVDSTGPSCFSPQSIADKSSKIFKQGVKVKPQGEYPFLFKCNFITL